MLSQRRKTTIAAGAVTIVVVTAAAVTGLVVTGGSGRATPAGTGSPGVSAGPTATDLNDPAAVGAAFLQAWQAKRYPQMQALVASSADNMTRAYGGLASRLHLTKVAPRPGTYDAGTTSLPFDVTLTLKGLGDVTYTSTIHLLSTTHGWRVHFTSGTVYPGLALGERLELADGKAPRGPVLDRSGHPLSVDADLTANLVGTVSADGRGVNGLQRVLDTGLGGTAGTVLAVVNSTTHHQLRVVKSWPGHAGAGRRTTIDLRMQRAAEHAIAGVTSRVALVAIDTASGEVRAIANRPVSGTPAALSGTFPPGSTFKVVTAAAALAAGRTPQSTVACPSSISVVGKQFHNHEGATTGTMTLTSAFAESCNTAFIGLGRSLPAGALAAAAARFGFGGGDPLPVASFGGELPDPMDQAEAAADAIGQGRVSASPLQMASVAAAVATGTWRQPHVLPCPDCVSHAIPGAASLRTMMRAVVTSGTGTKANAPGGPVYGKTGTAEFGAASPPATHAWFIGWQGATAFCVFVQDGVSGGAVAAPIAGRFLKALAAG